MFLEKVMRFSFFKIKIGAFLTMLWELPESGNMLTQILLTRALRASSPLAPAPRGHYRYYV